MARFLDFDADVQIPRPGFRLVTAEIIYRLPDAPALLQSYLWQDYDRAPELPRLTAFLDYWSANLDGALHSVRLARSGPGKAADYRHLDRERWLH
jgi:uncharacterized protein Usg